MIDEIFVDDEEEMQKESFEEIVIAEKEEIKPEIKFGDVVFNRKFKVFAKVNKEGFITDIESDVFLKDTTDWVFIDEGKGYRFVYPHTMYFGEPIVDEDGNYKFKVEK